MRASKRHAQAREALRGLTMAVQLQIDRIQGAVDGVVPFKLVGQSRGYARLDSARSRDTTLLSARPVTQGYHRGDRGRQISL